MSVSLTIQPAAGKDIKDLILWYDEKLPGLGSRFLSSLDRTIEAISRSPGIFQVRYRQVRMAPVAHFPISVHYQYFQEQGLAVVLAVLNHARNPASWPRE